MYIYRLDLGTEKINNLGQHSDSISSMNYSKESSEHSTVLVDVVILNTWTFKTR